MSVIHRLSGAAYGIHIADQIALVSVPLVAALAFDASPEIMGVLVACQSMAHLLGSIPFGILVDQQQLRTLAILSALTSLAGFSCAVLSVLLGSIIGFGAAITVAGFGVVLFSLTALSILPRAVATEALTRANAAIEIPRAFSTFAVPLLIGMAIGIAPGWTIFGAACAGSLLALSLSATLPRFDVRPRRRASTTSKLLEGGAYVLRQALLRPITLCAVFWNLAFAALLVSLVPLLRDVFQFGPGSFGFALSAFGLAAVFGSWLSGRLADRFAPSTILLFGPGSSVAAATGLMLIGPASPEAWLYACFFLLGFGPSMWLIAQNSVRQLVTPSTMLGRVNAVIQTAIYGIRPLGALMGGAVTGAFGPEVGLMLVSCIFLLSFLAAALSGLRSVKSYGALVRPDAAKS